MNMTEIERRRFSWPAAAWLTRPLPSSILLAVVVIAVALGRSIWPVSLGLADDGRGGAVLCGMGLGPAEPARGASYAVLDWVPVAGACPAVSSTLVLPLGAARWLTGLFGAPDGALDLRWMVAGMAVLLGVLVGVIAFLVRRPFLTRLAVGTAAAVLLTDTLFLSLAGSGYADSATVAGLAVAVIGVLFSWTRGVRQWVALAVAGVGAAFAIGSSPRMAVLLVPFVAVSGILTLRSTRSPEPSRLRRFWLRLLPRALSMTLALSVILVLPAVWTLGGPGPAVSAVTRIGGRLLADPASALVAIWTTGDALFSGLGSGLGTYTAASGAPAGAMAHSVLLEAGGIVTGFGVIPLVIMVALLSWGAVYVLRRSGRSTPCRSLATGSLLALGSSVVTFLSVAFTSGATNAHDLIVTTFSLALATALLLAAAVAPRERPQPAVHE